ncbi:LOW QUALITY PROTEIN: hypothetical protein MSG28_006715 [Choristoneura fumiferana]|uniref:Uncharacterized protein n=1 Tax=Choristoneura fumiferana TaxID=7141 RepID=A0ACC0JL04_CHOFU|nr:LOW QUALITY PROTEIN: hypothetical protein MSG28_006715 [Choristoneura fumiferana]
MRKNDDDTTAKEKEKEGCISDWLSGGPMGSKGVVLVFRSCVLASRTPSMESTTKTVGNNTGTTILLNKAKNMARRLVAEPHSFSVRPANIMHDVMETFGNTTKYTGQAYVVRHVSDAEVPETAAIEEQGHEPVEHKRDIEDVLNDLSKITLKKHLNIENTTANIKPPEEPPPPECSKVNTETKLLHRLLQAHGLQEATPEAKDFNLMWSGLHPKPDVLRRTGLLRALLEAHGLVEATQESEDWNFMWANCMIPFDVLQAMQPHQRVNHFPRSYELTRKDKLFKNIEKMQYFRGLKHFDFIPTTFLMPAEFKELCTTHYRTKGPWIVKPAASSRGRGIYIVNTPLLIGGHKCDLRLYVCVTSIDPLLIYLYEEGLVRFATWTLSALLRHLRKQGRNTTALMTAIEDLVVKSVLSSAQTITAAARVFVPNFFNCFDPVSGVPVCSTSLNNNAPYTVVQHNYNLLVHSHVLPHFAHATAAASLTDAPPPHQPDQSLTDAPPPHQPDQRSAPPPLHHHSHVLPHFAHATAAASLTDAPPPHQPDQRSAPPPPPPSLARAAALRARHRRRQPDGRAAAAPARPERPPPLHHHSHVLPHFAHATAAASLTDAPPPHQPDQRSAPPPPPPSLARAAALRARHRRRQPDGRAAAAPARPEVSAPPPPHHHSHVLPHFAHATAAASLTDAPPPHQPDQRSAPPPPLHHHSHVLPHFAHATAAASLTDAPPPHQPDQSMGEGRRAFGLYLTHVLKRVSSFSSELAVAHAGLVLRFLKRASNTLRMPYNVKMENYVTTFLSDTRSPFCVDLPAAKLSAPPARHTLLKHLACLAPINTRRYSKPEEQSVDSSEPPTFSNSDIVLKDSMKEEKPLTQALKYARS